MNKDSIINLILIVLLLIVVISFFVYMAYNIEYIKVNPCDFCEQMYNQTCFSLKAPHY